MARLTGTQRVRSIGLGEMRFIAVPTAPYAVSAVSPRRCPLLADRGTLLTAAAAPSRTRPETALATRHPAGRTPTFAPPQAAAPHGAPAPSAA